MVVDCVLNVLVSRWMILVERDLGLVWLNGYLEVLILVLENFIDNVICYILIVIVILVKSGLGM